MKLDQWQELVASMNLLPKQHIENLILIQIKFTFLIVMPSHFVYIKIEYVGTTQNQY